MHYLTINNLISNIKIYDLLIYYILYSFLGWCAEVCYAYKNQRKFVNRGFLYGPLCPIYGACILSVIIILENFHNNLFVMLMMATLLTSIVEYFTGLILEKLFKTKYWDYSDDPLNLHGRICLHFSLMWGTVCLVIVRIIHPFIVSVVTIVPENLRMTFSLMLFIYILIDFAETIKSLVNVKSVFYHLQFDGNLLNINMSRFDKQHIQNIFEDIKERLSNIVNKI